MFSEACTPPPKPPNNTHFRARKETFVCLARGKGGGPIREADATPPDQRPNLARGDVNNHQPEAPTTLTHEDEVLLTENAHFI